MTEIDLSEYMVNSRKYANDCSYFNTGLPKSIIQHVILVISIQKEYSL